MNNINWYKNIIYLNSLILFNYEIHFFTALFICHLLAVLIINIYILSFMSFSVFSTSDVDSSLLSIRNEPAAVSTSDQSIDFVQKIEGIKNISLKASFSDREFINVTRRKSLFGLTREPLKSYAKDYSEIQLCLSESGNVNTSSEFLTAKNADASCNPYLSSSRLKDDKTSKVTLASSLCDTEDPSKVVSTHIDEEPVQNVIDIESVQASHDSSSSVSSNSKRTTLSREALFNTSSTESVLNQSGSSSGNSSYNSASER